MLTITPVNIFIGIKSERSVSITPCTHFDVTTAPGAFQHSSFLGGGLVTSAGLISVKDGVIHKLSPLSGHYR